MVMALTDLWASATAALSEKGKKVSFYGQRIYVSPPHNAVAVRFGISEGGVDAWEEVLASVIAKVP